MPREIVEKLWMDADFKPVDDPEQAALCKITYEDGSIVYAVKPTEIEQKQAETTKIHVKFV